MQKILFVLILLSGCGLTQSEYEQYVRALPTQERVHNDEAVAIVADVYGIHADVANINWVTEPLYLTDHKTIVQGVSFLCDSWVYWSPDRPTSIETSMDFSNTAMAHEMAHCALYTLTGNADNGHKQEKWWSDGGLVAQARSALNDNGM